MKDRETDREATDPDFESRILSALAISVPPLKMPELPEIDPDAPDLAFESAVLEALEIPVPALKMPELPEIPAEMPDPAFESTISQALAIPVPALRMPELPEIEADNVAVLKPKRRAVPPVWIAMAASFVLMAIVGIQMFGHDHGGEFESLADEILAHLDHEPYALRVTDNAVSDNRLARVVPSELASIERSAGLITYAQSCEINGKTVPHLVIQGKNGPVTVILMPEERVLNAETLEGRGVNGVILPVGNGSIAIIGEKDEDLNAIQESVINSVTFST